MNKCNTCDGYWKGSGYCPECGIFDGCHYRLCSKGDNDCTSVRTQMALKFARNMQGNPLFL